MRPVHFSCVPADVRARQAQNRRNLAWSICRIQKESACREETVVYRFSPLQDKPGSFSVGADKIIDGKAVTIGTLEFQYVEDQHALVCEYAQGVWRLTVDGEEMGGTLTRPDGSLFRRVLLRKEQ